MANKRILIMKSDPVAEVNSVTEPAIVKNDIATEEQKAQPLATSQENDAIKSQQKISQKNSKTRSTKIINQDEETKNVKIPEGVHDKVRKILALNDYLKGVKIQEFVTEAILEKIQRVEKRGSN